VTAENPRHFFGKPCPRAGHGNERFRSDGTCVVCAAERVKARRAAKRRNGVTMNPKRFLGAPCGRCGGIERYVVDHSCCSCKAEQSRTRQAAAKAARQAAGTSKTYRGQKCRVCGNRLRSRATAKCVRCDRAGYRARNAHRTPLAEIHKQARTPNRKKALARGDRYYEGSPCSKCGHTQRFTRDGSCRTCRASHYQRMTPAARDRQLERQRNSDRRAYRALRVLQELGIPL
jgi:hypothetical protein